MMTTPEPDQLMRFNSPIPGLAEHRLKLFNYYKYEAAKMIVSKVSNINQDGTLAIEKRPEVSAEEFSKIVALVRDAFANGMLTAHHGAYIDILGELGGGLKALQIDDPHLNFYNFEMNIFYGFLDGSTTDSKMRERKMHATKDYFIRIEYARLLSWARVVSPLITHPLLSSHVCKFDSLDSQVATIMPTNLADKDATMTSAEVNELLRILLGCIVKMTPGSITLHSLYQYQSEQKPPSQQLISLDLKEAYNFFLSVTRQYTSCTSASPLPLTKTYKWYPKPIKNLLPEVFREFITEFSMHALTIPISGFQMIISFLNAAVEKDIRITRSLPPQCVAQILTALVDRVQKLTTESYPQAPAALRHAESALEFTLNWTANIFLSLIGAKMNGKESQYDFRKENIAESDDANLTLSFATALNPLLLRVLTSKMNPVVYLAILTFMDGIIRAQNLPEKVVLSFLTKQFWAGLITVFTDPYVDGVDKIRLHHYSDVVVEFSGDIIRKKMSTAKDFHYLAVMKCCRLLQLIGNRGLVRYKDDNPLSETKFFVKLGQIGKALLKRGLVPFLLEQDALYPDNPYISLTLAHVLGSMSRSRDGRVLMLHTSELGSRLAGIDLLRHFLLHSHLCVVREAFIICIYLSMDADWRPLLLAMDPPIEDIIAKWASVVIFRTVQVAEDDFEREQIKFYASLILVKNEPTVPSLFLNYWHFSCDFMDTPASTLKRRSDYFPTSVTNLGVKLLFYALELLRVLPTGSPHIYERFHSNKLIALTITGTLYAPTRQVCILALAKMILSGPLKKSDLLDPHRQIEDLAVAVTIRAKDFHVNGVQEIPTAEEVSQYLQDSYYMEGRLQRRWDKVPLYIIGSYFQRERSQPNSVWNEYFIALDENLSCDPDYQKLFWTKFPPTFFDNVTESNVDADQRFQAISQLKVCASESCKQVELTNNDKGKFKTCARCRNVWYCSPECQKADWKRHKVSECLSSNSNSGSSIKK